VNDDDVMVTPSSKGPKPIPITPDGSHKAEIQTTSNKGA
jgi:hypothetical protein